jgi:hypothetical protein
MQFVEKLSVPAYWYPQLAGGECIAWVDVRISVYPSGYPIFGNTYFAKGVDVTFVEGTPPRLLSPSRRLHHYHQRVYPPFGSSPTGVYIWGYDGVKVDLEVATMPVGNTNDLAQAIDSYLNDRINESLQGYITDQSLLAALLNYAKNADLQDAVATLNLLLQSKADLTALDSKVSVATFQSAIANLGTLIEGQIDPTELSIALGQFAQAQPQQLIRQSKVFEFKGVYSTNSTAFSAVGISASLPQPLLSTSKVRARFSGYAAIQSNSPRGLFTMARGTTLLHPSGTEGLAQCRGQDPNKVEFVVQDDAPGVSNPEYALFVKLTASSNLYLNRPGSNTTPITPSYLVLEEIA